MKVLCLALELAIASSPLMINSILFRMFLSQGISILVLSFPGKFFRLPFPQFSVCDFLCPLPGTHMTFLKKLCSPKNTSLAFSLLVLCEEIGEEPAREPSRESLLTLEKLTFFFRIERWLLCSLLFSRITCPIVYLIFHVVHTISIVFFLFILHIYITLQFPNILFNRFI